MHLKGFDYDNIIGKQALQVEFCYIFYYNIIVAICSLI
jgi:hypothetical protein